MPIGPRAISAAIAGRQASDIWSLFHGHAATLMPFWIACIDHFSKATGLDEEKRQAHLKSANAAFALMDDWRFARIRHVKARRNEIDSAISFVRNTALRRPIASLRASAAARNAAGALRVVLTASCRGYRDDQLPDLLSHAIFDIAAVRVRFPFDFGTLACFHPGDEEAAGDDPFVLMLERAAQRTGHAKEVQELYADVELLYDDIERPQAISPADWFVEMDDSNARVYYAAQHAFHAR